LLRLEPVHPPRASDECHLMNLFESLAPLFGGDRTGSRDPLVLVVWESVVLRSVLPSRGDAEEQSTWT
jgi:hypothetical protein